MKIDLKYHPSNAILPEELLISKGKKCKLIIMRKGLQKATYEVLDALIEDSYRNFKLVTVRASIISQGHQEILNMDAEGMNKSTTGLITFKYFIRL